jgi:putative MATE family efflux protein
MRSVIAPALRLPLLRQVTRLALPVVLANLLQTLVNVVDVFMAGRLGPVPVAAVGLAASVALLALLALQMVTAGAMALAAQARGADDDEELAAVTLQALLLGGLAALLVAAAGAALARVLLTFMNSSGDPTAVVQGTAYLRILFLGSLALMANLTLSALLQGAGDTVTPLWLGGGINVLNVGFDYLFMFGPGPFPALGVPGAALGTVCAWSIGAAAGLTLLLRGRLLLRAPRGRPRPDLTRWRDILAIGVPAGLQGTTYTLSRMVLLRIVTSTPAGTLGAAALAIGIQIESLAFMPGLALSVAATSMVGRALGAWQVQEARRRGQAALVLGLVVMSLVALSLLLFAPQWMRLFEPGGERTVIGAGVAYLRINALAQPVLAFFMVLSGALRGAGDTRPALLGTFVGRWLVTLPMAAFLALATPLGLVGAWWAMAAGTAVQAAWVTMRWRSGAWEGVALRGQRIFRLHLAHLPEAECGRFLRDIRTPLLAPAYGRERVHAAGVDYRGAGGEMLRVRFAPGPQLWTGTHWVDASADTLRAVSRSAEEGASTGAGMRTLP